jgi:hypothetical protein
MQWLVGDHHNLVGFEVVASFLEDMMTAYAIFSSSE